MDVLSKLGLIATSLLGIGLIKAVGKSILLFGAHSVVVGTELGLRNVPHVLEQGFERRALPTLADHPGQFLRPNPSPHDGEPSLRVVEPFHHRVADETGRAMVDRLPDIIQDLTDDNQEQNRYQRRIPQLEKQSGTAALDAALLTWTARQVTDDSARR